MSEIKYIIKRDGSKESFAPERIVEAIEKAAESLGREGEGIAEEVCKQVMWRITNDSVISPSVEEIQDLIECVLMENQYTDIAKSYIIYRYEREKQRERNYFTTYRKNLFENIKKRDGKIVVFDANKIFKAIQNAANALEPIDPQLNTKLTNQVIWYLNELFPPWEIPEVEEIQDTVEKVLMKNDLDEIARRYILYRRQRASKRKSIPR